MPKAIYKQISENEVYCGKCKNVYSLQHFSIHKFEDKTRFVCKINNKNFKSGGRTRRKSNDYEYMSLEYQRFYALLRKYGISEETWNRMFENQNGCCAICGMHQKDVYTTFCTDHNHTTKEVRGLLCLNCNSGLGQLCDNSEILQNAIEYLNKRKLNVNLTKIPSVKYDGSKDYFKDRKLIRVFSINLAEYNRLLQEQNYCCAVCKKSNDTLKQSLAVDHSHTTEEIRGLLCRSCNKGIGLFMDNVDNINNAIKYLNK